MLLSGVLAAALALASPRPPVPRTHDEITATLHGAPRHDEYAWMRAGPDDRAVRAHLRAENRYLNRSMRPHRRLMRALAREIEVNTYVDHTSVPVREGDWLYWTQTRGRSDHAVFLRRPAAQPTAAPQVLLDVNALARGREFIDVGLLEVSDDGNLLAYSIDETGSEDYTLLIKDLRTGVDRPDRLHRVTSAAWSADGREILYTVRDDTHRAIAAYVHTLGAVGPDKLLYAEKDPRFDLSLQRSRSREWLILASDAYTSSETRVAPASAPRGPWTLLAPRSDGHLYDVDHAGDTFYVRSNRDAPNFRVLTAPETAPQEASWKQLIPEAADVAISEVVAFDHYLALARRERGRPRVAIFDLATGTTRVTGDPQRVAAVWIGENPEVAASSVRVHVESAHAPESTLAVAFSDGAETLLGRRAAPGPCGGAVSSIGTARADDGVEVSYLVFAGAHARAPGQPRPVLLEAYGAYGTSFDPDFDPGRCALMNRGVDYVIAWVRGGGELGEPWHAAGRRHDRMRAVADLLTVATHLVTSKYTDTMVVAGDSAGGALVAGAVHARPELFAGAVLRVPFLDAIGTMADPTAPLTTIEYEEWGDPRISADYAVMRQWCPYSNVGGRRYPALLVESSLADSRVAYHEQTRYVARLRARGSGGPFLLHTQVHAGHGGPSTRRAWLRSRALEVAFILDRLGLTK